MSDLVGRLRTHVTEYYSGRPVSLALCKDAADEIECSAESWGMSTVQKITFGEMRAADC